LVIMSTPSRELLIVSPERWDEACFSVPAVRALAGSGLGVGILCQPQQRAFWETLPGLPVHTPADLNEEWQVALLWEEGPLVKTVRKAGIAKRIGPAASPKLARHLTETLRDTPHPTDHRVQFYLKAVEEMGVATAKPEFFAPVARTQEPDPGSILLIPVSDFGPSHQWPHEHWLELCAKLVEIAPSLTLVCNPDDGYGYLENKLYESLGERATRVDGDLKQPDLDLLARHSLVIAADGSLPHLAAHMGATCITLFGPNDPHWKRPLGRRHAVVRHHVPCAPCLMAACPLDLRCQKELPVEQVLKALQALSSARSCSTC